MYLELNIFWLLLPITALTGWWIGRSTQETKKLSKNIHPDYFKGLNFFLNEQPDKAIEVFIRMVEVDNETAETHLALGNLFRRRGDVDRAIRIHQTLITRPTLNQGQRVHTLLDLSMDYMRSGLLDRAEKLFSKLVDLDLYLNEAYFNLLEIYQELRNRAMVQCVDKLIEYTLSKSKGEIYKHLSTIKKLTTKLIEKKPTYKCNNCGFDVKMLHWQCSGCKHWESIKPIFGVAGE
jgi:lipopolysaccharide biosynthesis regulator YciM